MRRVDVAFYIHRWRHAAPRWIGKARPTLRSVRHQSPNEELAMRRVDVAFYIHRWLHAARGGSIERDPPYCPQVPLRRMAPH